MKKYTKEWFLAHYSNSNGKKCQGISFDRGSIRIKMAGEASYPIDYQKGWTEKIIKAFDLIPSMINYAKKLDEVSYGIRAFVKKMNKETPRDE